MSRTLNEAIRHEMNIAEKQEELAKVCVVEQARDSCLKCANEHRQLVEWLKELKAVKDIIRQHDEDSMPEDFWYIDKIREEVQE